MNYRELADHLAQEIRAGELPFGQRFYSASDLIKKFKTTTKTANNALDFLIKQGMVFREKGRGTFVGKRKLEAGFVVLLLPNIASEYCHIIVRGLEAALGSTELELVYFPTRNNYESTFRYIATLDPLLTRAVVFVPFQRESHQHNPGIISQLQQKTNQIIILDREINSQAAFAQVRSNNFLAAAKLAEYLYEKDCDSFTFVSSSIKHNTTLQERYNGFAKSLESYGVEQKQVKLLEWELGRQKEVGLLPKLISKAQAPGLLFQDSTEMNLCRDYLLKISKEGRTPVVSGFDLEGLPKQLSWKTANQDFQGMVKSIIDFCLSGKKEKKLLPVQFSEGDPG